MDLAIHAWPITLAFGLSLVAALLVGSPLRDPQLRRRMRMLPLTYVIPILIVAIGAVLHYDGPRPEWVEPPSWRIAVLYALVSAHLLAFLVAVVLMKGARIRTAAVVLPGIWLTLSTYFIAGIAIVGIGP